MTVRDVSELTPAQRRLLSVASKSKGRPEGTARLDIRSKLQALDKLCRLFGLYAPDPRSKAANAPRDIPRPMSDVERAQRLAAILREADPGDDE